MRRKEEEEDGRGEKGQIKKGSAHIFEALILLLTAVAVKDSETKTERNYP